MDRLAPSEHLWVLAFCAIQFVRELHTDPIFRAPVLRPGSKHRPGGAATRSVFAAATFSTRGRRCHTQARCQVGNPAACVRGDLRTALECCEAGGYWVKYLHPFPPAAWVLRFLTPVTRQMPQGCGRLGSIENQQLSVCRCSHNAWHLFYRADQDRARRWC